MCSGDVTDLAGVRRDTSLGDVTTQNTVTSRVYGYSLAMGGLLNGEEAAAANNNQSRFLAGRNQARCLEKAAFAGYEIGSFKTERKKRQVIH